MRAPGPSLLLLAALLALPARPGEAEENPDRILFHDGDRLSGRLEGGSPGTGILWRHGEGSPPIVFRYGAVSEIRLGARPAASPAAQGRFRFANGDVAEGRLVELGPGHGVLETPEGSRLRFGRGGWQWAVFDRPPGRTVFSGPRGLEGWTRSEVELEDSPSGHWEYANGYFYASDTASIARDIRMPDRARVEFEYHWQGIPNLALALYTDSLGPISLGDLAGQPAFSKFYSVQFLYNYANILPVDQAVPLQRLGLGQIQIPSFLSERSARVDLRIDLSASSIALIMDGELIKTWTDPAGSGNMGTGIRLVHQGHGSSVAVGRLRVSEWDGKFETAPRLRPAGAGDLATLHTGESHAGRILSLAEGTLRLEAADGSPASLPLEDVAKIELAGVPGSPSPGPDGEPAALARSVSGLGLMRLELRSIGEGRLQGTSPNFGEVDLPLEAFGSLQLSPR